MAWGLALRPNSTRCVAKKQKVVFVLFPLGQKEKKALVSVHRSGFKIGAVMFLGFVCFGNLSFLKDISCSYLEPDQISHTQSMVAKRGRTNRANVHKKKLFKTQRG